MRRRLCDPSTHMRDLNSRANVSTAHGKPAPEFPGLVACLEKPLLRRRCRERELSGDAPDGPRIEISAAHELKCPTPGTTIFSAANRPRTGGDFACAPRWPGPPTELMSRAVIDNGDHSTPVLAAFF